MSMHMFVRKLPVIIHLFLLGSLNWRIARHIIGMVIKACTLKYKCKYSCYHL